MGDLPPEPSSAPSLSAQSESASSETSPSETEQSEAPKPLNAIQRRILGVLIEKARTTPDAYPLSLNALITGSNQKSNRSPLMKLTTEQVEDELVTLRELGVVAEVHGGGRVPKYRHYGYDYLGVKGVEAGVMAELLLRGAQTAGDLRTRASRFEPIQDLATMNQILQKLIAQNLVVALTPPGRGQLFTHALYPPDELSRLREQIGSGQASRASAKSASNAAPPNSTAASSEIAELRKELSELRHVVQQLGDRLERLES